MKVFKSEDKIIGLFLIAILACAFMGVATQAQARSIRAKVERVKDGDTFVLAGFRTLGVASEVRVLGFDTPESRKPLAQCDDEIMHGKKAGAFAADLVAKSGGTVWLSSVKKGPRKDVYGRFLYRVFLRINGKRVSWADAMIDAGYGLAYNVNRAGLLIKPDWCAILSKDI